MSATGSLEEIFNNKDSSTQTIELNTSDYKKQISLKIKTVISNKQDKIEFLPWGETRERNEKPSMVNSF